MLLDRSSRPRRCPSRLPLQRVEAIERLRRLRMTAAEIAEVLELPLSTVSLWLKRIGLGKRSRLDPLEPPNRYERRHPGELVHIDIKKLERISALGAGHRGTGVRSSEHIRTIGGRKTRLTGYEYLHVVVDDYSRLAYAEVLDDLTAACAIAFLRRAVAPQPRSQTAPDQAWPTSNQRQSRTTDPDTPQRMGLRPPLRQLKRTNAALPLYLDRYNYRRPHSSLSHQPPASRLNNLVGNYN
jgi:hypothetical protein